MGLNMKIIALREQLVAAVNSSGLPAGICSLVVGELHSQVQELARADLARERAEETAEKEAKTNG